MSRIAQRDRKPAVDSSFNDRPLLPLPLPLPLPLASEVDAFHELSSFDSSAAGTKACRVFERRALLRETP